MVVAAIYNMLLLTAGVAALSRGGRAEKMGALIMAVATCLSVFGTPDNDVLYSAINARLTTIDGLTFFAFVVLTCRAKEFWPVWVASMQLLTFAANFAPLSDKIEHRFAYALNEQLWAWPILALILVMSIWGPRLHDWATTTRSP